MLSCARKIYVLCLKSLLVAYFGVGALCCLEVVVAGCWLCRFGSRPAVGLPQSFLDALSPGIKFSQYPLYINAWSPDVLNPAHKRPILAMSVPLQSSVGCDPLGPLPLPPDFEAMSKKAQQPWRMCQRLEQLAYPVNICFSC